MTIFITNIVIFQKLASPLPTSCVPQVGNPWSRLHNKPSTVVSLLIVKQEMFKSKLRYKLVTLILCCSSKSQVSFKLSVQFYFIHLLRCAVYSTSISTSGKLHQLEEWGVQRHRQIGPKPRTSQTYQVEFSVLNKAFSNTECRVYFISVDQYRSWANRSNKKYQWC